MSEQCHIKHIKGVTRPVIIKITRQDKQQNQITKTDIIYTQNSTISIFLIKIYSQEASIETEQSNLYFTRKNTEAVLNETPAQIDKKCTHFLKTNNFKY